MTQSEGVDIPSLDLLLFLRPTESPIVFLQQLGRGLRTCEGKRDLRVLDFIGNFKKVELIPLLLGEKGIKCKLHVVPPSPSSWYSHYEADNENDIRK